MTPSERFQSEYLAEHAAALREILRKPEGYRYSSMEEAVAKEGTPLANEPLTTTERATLRPILKDYLRWNRPKLKHCYMNTYHFVKVAAQHGVPLQYTEGFGLNLIAALHAWGVYHGKPIDVTWRKDLDDKRYSVEGVLDRIDENIRLYSYVGFAVPLSYLEKLIREQGVYASALDDWKNGWPIVKHGLAALREKVTARLGKKLPPTRLAWSLSTRWARVTTAASMPSGTSKNLRSASGKTSGSRAK